MTERQPLHGAEALSARYQKDGDKHYAARPLPAIKAGRHARLDAH